MTQARPMKNIRPIAKWLKEVEDIETLYLNTRVPQRIVNALRRYIRDQNYLTVQGFINEALENSLKDKGAL